MSETVNHPSHYQSEAGIEVIDIIEAYKLSFHLGNAIKYLLRAGRKDENTGVQDFEKALWYIARELKLRGYIVNVSPNGRVVALPKDIAATVPTLRPNYEKSGKPEKT